MCATKLTQRTALKAGLVLVLVVVLFLLVLQLRQTIFTHWRSIIWFSIYYSVAQFATFFANRAVSFSTFLLILLIKAVATSESAISNIAFGASITVSNFATLNLGVSVNIVAARASIVCVSGLLLLLLVVITPVTNNPVFVMVIQPTMSARLDSVGNLKLGEIAYAMFGSVLLLLLLLLLFLIILAIVAIRTNPVLTVVVASTLIVFSAVDGDFATAFGF
jgi:hypothetical protein